MAVPDDLPPVVEGPAHGLSPAMARMQADMRDVRDAIAVLRFLAEEDVNA
jgi:hypothetical protein